MTATWAGVRPGVASMTAPGSLMKLGFSTSCFPELTFEEVRFGRRKAPFGTRVAADARSPVSNFRRRVTQPRSYRTPTSRSAGVSGGCGSRSDTKNSPTDNANTATNMASARV